MGTNQCESQKGMTPYGLGRQVIYVNGNEAEMPKSEHNTLYMQTGTSEGPSQKGMTPYGLSRQIC